MVLIHWSRLGCTAGQETRIDISNQTMAISLTLPGHPTCLTRWIGDIFSGLRAQHLHWEVAPYLGR